MIVLVGFMGAGKTTVGELLARRLGVPFVDSDRVIEEGAGCGVAEIFAVHGEQRFRDLERDTVAQLVDAGPGVLSLGGGAVTDERTRQVLAGAEVVHLEVGYEEVRRRLPSDDARPVLRRPDLGDVYRSRLPAYASVATLTVATDGRLPEEVVEEIVRGLTRGP